MAKKPDVLRPTDDEARRLARMLVRASPFASLAVIEPGTGHPSSSRVLLATDIDCCPVILVSALAMHAGALKADPRASLLCGEPGKGDPLAWPRITVACRAETIDRDSEAGMLVRQRFLRRHPKSRLYIDFGDFSFFRLVPLRASLNGGFGRAFAIEGNDLLADSQSALDLARHSAGILRDGPAAGTGDHAVAVDHFAGNLLSIPLLYREFKLIDLDCDGIYMKKGNSIRRFEFMKTARNLEEFVAEYSDILNVMH